MKEIVACAFSVLAASLFAVTLNVDLNVTHGIYTGGADERDKCHSVVYFVIDRSGSMRVKSLSDGRSPNEVLIESLKLRLEAIPLGTEVHVLPFSNTIWKEMVYEKLSENSRTEILDFIREKTPEGQTVLYDAQDMALTAAGKIMEQDAAADVRVLVYTDGNHLTKWNYEGEYKARYEIRKGGLGRRVFEENPEYQNELAAAKKKFKEKFADLIAKPNFEIEYEWLSKDPKPEADMITKASIPVELTSQTPMMLNPLEYPNQMFKGTLRLPITDKCWNEVVDKPFTVTWAVGGKTVKTSLTLKDGHQTCKVEWPSLPEDTSEKAALTCISFPEGRKFTLKDTKSVNYDISAVQKVTIQLIEPEEYDGVSEDSPYSVGSPVTLKLKVEGVAKSVLWTVMHGNEKVATMTSTVKDGFAIEKFVPKIGDRLYNFSVAVESLAGRKQIAEGQFHVLSNKQ